MKDTQSSYEQCTHDGCNNPPESRHMGAGNRCWKHYRIRRMRHTAKSRGLSVPSVDLICDMAGNNADLTCPHCGVQMVWHRDDGTRGDLVTLQHCIGGGYDLICHKCNVKHGNTKHGDCFEWPDGSYRCCRCSLLKPLCEFNKKAASSTGRDYRCKDCTRKYLRQYWHKNREVLAEKARNYYRKRKEQRQGSKR